MVERQHRSNRNFQAIGIGEAQDAAAEQIN
jgi:hypothetical protein